MEKATEHETISITLEEKSRKLLAYELEKNIKNIPLRVQEGIPQFKFLESVLQKIQDKSKAVMLFSARECATLSGWLMASFGITKEKRFRKIRNIIEDALSEWKKLNP